VLAKLAPQAVDAAVSLLALPETIRGYGPIKDKAAIEARRRRGELLAALDEPTSVAPRQLAAE
jgi:indolepyruvate ferredoxin oxidoreductase